MVDLAILQVDLEVPQALRGVEFGRAEFDGLFLLRVRAGEDHNFTTHLSRKLDGEVAEPTDTDNTHTIRALHAVKVQCIEDSRAATHQGRRILGLHALRNLE